jgi:Tfp pilus assembly protein PilO
MKIFLKTSNYEKYYKELVPYLKKENSQKYFIIVLSLTASIFFLIFAINPTLSTIAKLKKQISDAQYVEQMLSQKIKNISNLSQEYQIIENDIPLIMDAVPQSPQIPTFVGQIQTLGQESSIMIVNIEVLPVNLNSRIATQSSSFTFEISGNSSYENMQKFIDDLIKMQRALSIIGIQTSKDTETDSIDFIIKGLAYFKK